MAQKDTTKKGVSDAGNNAEDYVRIERDGDVNSIVENAKITRQLEAAGVDINNPMEVNLAMQKLEKGEDPNPNAGKEDPGSNELEGGDPNLEAHEELDKPVIKDDDHEMVIVKINGVEKRVLKSEVDAEGGVVAYQKARAADERMHQAATEKKQLDEREKKLTERELAISQQEQAQLSNKNSKQELSDDAPVISDKAKVLNKKMYSGDEKQTEEAVQEILDAANKQPATQEVDTQEIIDQTAAKVQWQTDLVSAKAMFAAEYSEIDSNPEYRKYADQATNRIAAEHKDWTPTQIIREAGEQAKLKFADQLREKENHT